MNLLDLFISFMIARMSSVASELPEMPTFIPPDDFIMPEPIIPVEVVTPASF